MVENFKLKFLVLTLLQAVLMVTLAMSLKKIVKFVCIGQSPGDELPTDYEISMRQQYLLKQISIAFQKWRSNLFTDSLKFFSCDLHPGHGPFRFDCRYSIPAFTRPHPNETHNIASGRVYAISPIFFSEEDQDSSEMINNIVDLTSSYTELVDNLVSVSSVWAINWYLTLGTV